MPARAACAALALLLVAGCAGDAPEPEPPKVCARAWLEGEPASSWTLRVAVGASEPGPYPLTVSLLGPGLEWNETRDAQAGSQVAFSPPALGEADATVVVLLRVAGEPLIMGRLLLERGGGGHNLTAQPDGFLSDAATCTPG